MLGRPLSGGRWRLAAVALLISPLTLLAGQPLAQAVVYDTPPEDYASYQPQTTCRKHPMPGTKALAAWINRKFSGGTAAATMSPCNSGGTSEHKDGRAIDWMMDATKATDRDEVARFFDKLFATDADGNPHALARRMGIMYLIWNDHIYASYRHFESRDYLNSACPSLDKCSKTLRHRDHVHISLSRPGGRGDTSWYAGRV